MTDGVAVLQPDGSDVRGVVRFIDEMGGLRISYRVTGLTDGEHGFHIHEYGDLTDGCKSACAHFNPDGMTHGGLDTAVRHFGDLGNITSSKSVAEGELFLANGRLDTSRYGILGRMIIVHADRDDLGEGGDEESLKTGNAGKRLACGVIGLADPDTDNMTMDAESRTLEAPYQPDQEISDYTPRDLATSSAITGDFTTDSLKYGFGPTSLSAEDHWIDHFLPGPNINPHDDPAYDEPYVQCESNYDCPNPARTGPFNYSGGYIGKVTACRECWQAILEMYEEEFQEGVVQPSGTAWQDEWAAEDDYDSTYGKEQAKIRRRLKKELMGEATMGTKAGEWSARKSQELKRRYEAACERKGIKPYKGSKTSKQKDLSAWSKQGWRTASGRKSSVTGEPYFPAKAVKALKERDLYSKAKRQKADATRAGKQRATYSKDIQAVVARYRAEDDHTIDDLDSDTLINRMDAIGVLMDEIVRKHGNSYEKAERDPTYLRLASQHNALARAYARREGFGAEDLTIEEPPMDIEEEAQARLEAIRQLQWGVRVIERMLREGNIDDAREFARITVEAMGQEEDAARDLGLDPDRFSAEDGSDSGCYDPDHGDCNSCFEICLDCHPEKIGGQDSIGENICMDCVARQMAHKEPCKCGYETSYSTRRCMECLKCFGCEVQLYESGDYGMVCTDCAPNVYGFNAESEDGEFDPWAYSMVYPHHDPDWLYEHHIVQGLSAQDIAGMLGVPVNTVTRRIHEFGLYDVESRTGRSRSGDRYRTARVNETKELLSRGYSTKEIAEILGVSDYTVRTYRREIRSQFDAEEDDDDPMEQMISDFLMDPTSQDSMFPNAICNDCGIDVSFNTGLFTNRLGSDTIQQLYDDDFDEFMENGYGITSRYNEDTLEWIFDNPHLVDTGYRCILCELEAYDDAPVFVDEDDLGMPDRDAEVEAHLDQACTSIAFAKPLHKERYWNEFKDRFKHLATEYPQFFGGNSPKVLGRDDSSDGAKGDSIYREAEDDPVSRIAAGTNDALADFANAHDTDDGFYFVGGLIGGLLIAVAGNIISDRLQDWWRSRSA